MNTNTKLVCALLAFLLTGCADDPMSNGTVVIHLKDSGIVVSCESERYLDGHTQPVACSPTVIKDDRTKSITPTALSGVVNE